MEAAEHVVAVAPPPISHNEQQHLSPPIAKGKRTKRKRPHSPLPFTTPYNDPTTNKSPTVSASSSDDESTTTVEEDTARSLILLAQGHFVRFIHPQNRGYDDYDDDHVVQRDSKRKRPAESAVAAADGGACMYACKTCDRVFSSFQALGGHRASHKKPKLNERIKSAILSDEEDLQSPLMLSIARTKLPPTSVSLQLNNLSAPAAVATKTFPSPRMHMCSYCGAEFTSGQALGGHMRRHRGGVGTVSPPYNVGGAPVEEPEEQRKPRNGLTLDLNLPAAAAAEDENRTIDFDSRQRKSAAEKFGLSTAVTSTLVDCHF